MAAISGGGGGMTCPHCHGNGEQRAQLYGCREGRSFCEWRMLLCRFCAGTGRISGAQADAEERGRLLREDRIERGMTLRQEAKRLGVTPKQLSDQEWGRS